VEILTLHPLRTEFMFARVRIRFTPAVVGTYTVTHPWGVDKVDVTAADLGSRLDVTKDWGGFAPITNATPPVASSFERILYSPAQWRFMRATTLAPGVDPLAWIGDGITLTTITGGLNNVNTFTINGPATTTGGLGPVVRLNQPVFRFRAHRRCTASSAADGRGHCGHHIGAVAE